MKTIYLHLILLSLAHGLWAQTAVTRENLGRTVNSNWTEMAPVISADGRILYLVRDQHPDNKCNQAVWYSELQADSTWSVAKRMDGPFNKEENNFISSASADGNRLLVPNAYSWGDYIGKGYSFTHRTKGGWSNFQQLVIKNYANLAKGNFAFANLAADGNKIVMCFSPSGSDEDNDLFISFHQGDINWSEPVSLGANINSRYNEITPFLASDGMTLYFASNRPGGYGQYDIYRCKRLDNSYTRWSDPVNLGPDFNTANSEAYYALDAKGEYAYLSSSEKSFGGKDIIRIKLQPENQPQAVVLVSGTILNAKGNPVEATITYELLSSGKQIGQATTNPKDGTYKIVLPQGNEYGYTVQAKDHFPVSANLDLTDVGAYLEKESSFNLQPIKKGETVRINNLFFEYATSNILPTSLSELDRLYDLLKSYRHLEIQIAGHTDNKGNSAYNLKLSEQRAQSVKEYLIGKGIDANRLTTIGYGDTQPQTSNETDEGRATNRRVEFQVTDK